MRAVFVGVTSSATVAGGFVFGLPSLIAVLLNYLKRSDVRGTWLESHFPLADPHLLVHPALAGGLWPA
jgi:ABC-type tungstate transport system substrate-binding protein